MSRFKLRPLIYLLVLATLTGCASTPYYPKSCIDAASCINLLRQKVQAHMLIDETFRNKKAVVEFHLNEKAEVIQYKLLSSSGLSTMDKSVKDAVFNASPFSALLPMLKSDFDTFSHIKITFMPEI